MASSITNPYVMASSITDQYVMASSITDPYVMASSITDPYVMASSITDPYVIANSITDPHSYPAHFKRRSWRPPPISFQDKTLYNTTWSEEQGVERDRAGRELKKGEEGCNEIEEGLREERIEAVEEGDEG
ncbi:hypothetical protein Pmani_008088 [Petrolisthes manimaculis]|uniref:Uncharacterized protein n=1 Tax=Petrolisthes manimaculis TaxID=1843537 RepID=A0AAE1Q792_9EUCA|nr:hypothetical protein Pmani_008088 [Petrolisthes manimaculis]